MKRTIFEVTIKRIETCSVRVVADSEAEAIERAATMESQGLVVNYGYSDEHFDARRLSP